MAKYHGHANRMSRSIKPDYYARAEAKNARSRNRRRILIAILILLAITCLVALLFGIFTCNNGNTQPAMDKKPVTMQEPKEEPREKKTTSKKTSKKKERRESAFERALREDREPPETSIHIITE